MISGDGISTDPTKIQAIKDWPVPSNVKQLRGFLGLAGYYRKFVKNFGIIAKPLTELLCKDVDFKWADIHDDAFQLLNSALVSAPCLALPDFSLPFHIETDASAIGVGVVLMQQGHPLAFISKALGPKNQGLSTYEKECMAIVVAVDQWRPYLLQNEFFIHTDQRSLVHLNEQRLHTPWQQKLFTKLLGLNYKIVYKKGIENGAADALSRCPTSDILLSVFAVASQWLSELQDSYTHNEEARLLLTKLSMSQSVDPHFTLQAGLFRYDGKLWLGHNVQFQQRIFAALHDSALGGHSGRPATYQRIKPLFYWPTMKNDIFA